MLNKKVRIYISLIIPAVTIAACTLYLSSHHSLLSQLIHTKAKTIVSVFLMYILMIVILGLILDATLRICSKRLGNKENVVLNAYSLLANFFIPGQSGPALRGAYLKKRASVKIRNFITVTLLYYVLYAAVSIMLLVLGSKSWRDVVLAGAVMAAAIAVAIYTYKSFIKLRLKDLDLSPVNVLYLLGVTVLQALVQIAIYSIELHSSNGAPLSLGQILAYTGAANLALFVALTPGAIGIRETFLMTAHKLHHISNASIVVANIIDRSVYLLFLLMLGVILLVLSLQTKNQSIQKLLPEKLKVLPRPTR